VSVNLVLTDDEAERLMQHAESVLDGDYWARSGQRMGYDERRMWEHVYHDLRHVLRGRSWRR
jgi:hypothetical protein